MTPFLSIRMCSAGQCESGKERALATKLLREVLVPVRQEHVHTKSAEKWKTGSALRNCWNGNNSRASVMRMDMDPQKNDEKHISTSGNVAFPEHGSPHNASLVTKSTTQNKCDTAQADQQSMKEQRHRLVPSAHPARWRVTTNRTTK